MAAAAAWTTTRKATTSTSKAALSALASCVAAAGGVTRTTTSSGKAYRKGYLPIVLVRGSGDDDDAGTVETETMVLVRVSDLKEPCMAALLEAAEEQFGYGQLGVLKVPCDAQRFHHVVNMARKQIVRSS
jgi:SAUR family protein